MLTVSWHFNLTVSCHCHFGRYEHHTVVATQVVLYDAALRTKMHMDYFKLIQTALQSGPMAGSKPGKFHVGQEEVAVVAELFLKTVGGLHIRCNFCNLCNLCTCTSILFCLSF